MKILETIRKLPDGTKGRCISAAHKIAWEKHVEANGQSAQYATWKILYYDEDTWEHAFESVFHETIK